MRFCCERTLRKRVKQEIAVIVHIIGAGRNAESVGYGDRRAQIDDEILIKPLIGVADTVAVIECAKIAAGVAQRGGQRDQLGGMPRDNGIGFPFRYRG